MNLNILKCMAVRTVYSTLGWSILVFGPKTICHKIGECPVFVFLSKITPPYCTMYIKLGYYCNNKQIHVHILFIKNIT